MYKLVGLTTLYRLCRWQGTGQEEKGVDKATGKVRVEVDPRYYRPTEVVSPLLYSIFGELRNNLKCTYQFSDLFNSWNSPLFCFALTLSHCYYLCGYEVIIIFMWVKCVQDLLLGDASKARTELGWTAKTTFKVCWRSLSMHQPGMMNQWR
jgi:GDP-D-mannose dehydratase